MKCHFFFFESRSSNGINEHNIRVTVTEAYAPNAAVTEEADKEKQTLDTTVVLHDYDGYGRWIQRNGYQHVPRRHLIPYSGFKCYFKKPFYCLFFLLGR